MAGQTNILEVILVQCDLRIITVGIIQPYLVMVDYIPRLVMAQLTDAAIDCLALIYVRLSRSLPWCAFIELLLIHRRTTSSRVIPPPTAPAYVIPAYIKETHSQALGLRGIA